jgi:hypothetical protein
LARLLVEDPAFPHRASSRTELLRVATIGMDPASAVELYERVFPALRSHISFADQYWDWPNSTVLEFARAEVDYARLLIASGNREAAAFFLDDAEAFTGVVPRMGRLGFGTLDAEIATVRGDDERAMTLLKESVDAGWVANWWWELRHNPTLASLHQREDYKRLVEQLESSTTRQRTEPN